MKGNDEWRTPRWLFDLLDQLYHFNFDGAASAENHLCPQWFGFGSGWDNDALSANIPGDAVIFCNPPYSKCAAFLAWAHAQSKGGAVFVMLVPARTDTTAWHDHIWNGAAQEVYFIKGRLSSAPFPSAVVIYKKSNQNTFMPEGLIPICRGWDARSIAKDFGLLQEKNHECA